MTKFASKILMFLIFVTFIYRNQTFIIQLNKCTTTTLQPPRYNNLIPLSLQQMTKNAVADRYFVSEVYDDDENTELILDDFEQILDAIYIFKNIFGDLDISTRFEVPDTNPWPSHLHGLRLGKRLEKILSTPEFFEKYPNYVQSLKKLGFEPSVSTLIDDWAVILQGLTVHKHVYGHLRVPSKFVVPDHEPWPRLCRNMKLGVRVAAMRSAGRYIKDRRERKEDLDKLGFEWQLRSNTYKQQVSVDLFDQVYTALLHYKSIYNNVNVSANFVVPAEADWPKSIWRLELGALTQSILNKDKLVFGHDEREKLLIDLGFSWEDSKRMKISKQKFDSIYDGLVIYKELYGDLFVPQTFCIPEEDPWPEELWGLKLGARVNAIRSQGTLLTNSPDRR